ncbi:acyltransferase [Vibrio diabolicus]|uniref:acyltransferase n=1 Tax=Vibrio diabolicus TaxID=50719 RepID=UPI00293F9201|nr:acyltransferase [Vibrio diabolicus]MDV5037619.1 acyltransferase [Vibrio diabolicus]
MLKTRFLNKLIKAKRNPGFAVKVLWKYLFSLLSYPINFILYRKVGRFSFVSIRSSVINRRRINLGKNVEIGPFCTIWPLDLNVGDKVQINPGTVVYGVVEIGEMSMIGPNCNIIGGNHNFSDVSIPMIVQGSTEKGVIIENDVWLGAGVTVLDGVKIGTGAIVAAGTVVTKSVAPYTINAGIPNKKISDR